MSLLADLAAVRGTDLSSLDDAGLAGLGSLISRGRRDLGAFATAVTLEAKRRAAAGSSPAPDDIVDPDRDQSSRARAKDAARGEIRKDLPEAGEGAESGAAKTENADHLAAALRRLSSSEKERLAAHDREIAAKAAELYPEAFATWLARLLVRIADRPADDGLSAAERARAKAAWTMIRRPDGTWTVAASMDDERGMSMDAAVTARAREIANLRPPGQRQITANDRATAAHELLCGITLSADSAGGCSCSAGCDRSGSGGAGGSDSLDSSRSGAPDSSAADLVTPCSAAGDAHRAASRDGGRPGCATCAGPAGAAAHSGVPGGHAGSGRAACECSHGPAAEAERAMGPNLAVGIIVDAATLVHGPHAHSVAETWDGHPLDPLAARRRCCDADWYTIIYDALGRPTRVGMSRRYATREQRLQLRGLYPTCPLDGVTPFARCEIHHVNLDYELGGETELHNLVPISVEWHHRVHEGGWTLTMDTDRTLRLERPDGTLDRVVDPPRPLTRQGR